MNSVAQSDSEAGKVFLNGNGGGKAMSIKRISRALRTVSLKQTGRVTTRQDTNSLKKRKWFDDLESVDESRKDERNQNGQAVVDVNNIGSKKKAKRSNDVNADAEKFLNEYNRRTRFWPCAVCGADEGLVNLKPIDSDVQSVVEKSDLPGLYTECVSSTQRMGALSYGYRCCIQNEFHSTGLLKNAQHICTECLKVLKRGKYVEAASVAKSSGVQCGCDEDVVSDDGSTAESDDEEDEPVVFRPVPKWNIPSTALLRGLYPGIVPIELKGLRTIEVSMISIYNPVTRLKLNSKGMSYKYYHGSAHTYNIVNDLTRVASQLPWLPTINSYAVLKYKNDVCVKELKYRPAIVKRALTWLKNNNHLYKDIAINYPPEWNTFSVEHEVEPETMVLEATEEELAQTAGVESNSNDSNVHSATDENGNINESYGKKSAIQCICIM